MALAPNHPKVMKSHTGIDARHNAQNITLQPILLTVTDDHRIIMDHQVYIVLFMAQPFQVIDQLMTEQGVFFLIHLYMHTGKALAGAVIVNHQVVVA